MRGIVEREAVVKLDILFCFFSFGKGMEDKFKMDELIEQMKLMNSQMTEIKGMVHIMNERMGNIEKALEESIYDQHRTSYERKSARQIFQQNRQLLRRRLGRDRCPECPKSRGSEACPKCSPLNFCFLAEHGNSSDDATSKDMCPKCFPRRTFVETLDTATQRRVRRIRARV